MNTFNISNKLFSYDVSKIIFGTTYLGNMDDRNEAFKQLDCYYNNGGNCIDTARVYSNLEPQDKCPSEVVIGDWLKQKGIRDKIIISTKGGHPPYGNMNKSRLSFDDISFDLNESLKALQTDYIDIYWLHRDDESIPVSDIMTSLNKLIDTRKIRIIGASNWTAKRINEANEFAKNNNMIGFSCSQIQWSLAKTTPIDLADETLICMNEMEYKFYLESKIPVMAYNSQAKGLFSKMDTMEIDKLPVKILKRFLNENNKNYNIEKYKKIKTLAEKNNVSLAVISLGYLINNNVSAGAIIGCSNIEQLNDSMHAGDFILSPEEIKFIDE